MGNTNKINNIPNILENITSEMGKVNNNINV